jgi:hypothetical protein
MVYGMVKRWQFEHLHENMQSTLKWCSTKDTWLTLQIFPDWLYR